MKRHLPAFFVILVLLFALAACGKAPSNTTDPEEATTTQTPALQDNTGSTQQYEGLGVVVSFMAEKKFVNINHETLPGFMDAMTMPFEVKDATLLDGIQEGDSITFRFTAADGIQSIQKIQ